MASKRSSLGGKMAKEGILDDISEAAGSQSNRIGYRSEPYRELMHAGKRSVVMLWRKKIAEDEA